MATPTAAEFAQFYLGTLAGRSAAQWEPLRSRFISEVVVPRIPRDVPLLDAVDVPVAVDADARLAVIARHRRWRSLSLR